MSNQLHLPPNLITYIKVHHNKTQRVLFLLFFKLGTIELRIEVIKKRERTVNKRGFFVRETHA